MHQSDNNLSQENLVERLADDPQGHRGEEFGTSTCNKGIGSSLETLSDIVGALGHESNFLESPDGVLGDKLAGCGHAEDSYHFVSASMLLPK